MDGMSQLVPASRRTSDLSRNGLFIILCMGSQLLTFKVFFEDYMTILSGVQSIGLYLVHMCSVCFCAVFVHGLVSVSLLCASVKCNDLATGDCITWVSSIILFQHETPNSFANTTWSQHKKPQ